MRGVVSRVGFIVTNLETDCGGMVQFYQKRRTAGHWVKAGKEAVKLSRLTGHRFRANKVRLV
jgi:hypothetical protein